MPEFSHPSKPKAVPPQRRRFDLGRAERRLHHIAKRDRPAAPGHYALDNHTLTLIYPDGRHERHFFAFASRKNPAMLDPGMNFIDDTSYTSED